MLPLTAQASLTRTKLICPEEGLARLNRSCCVTSCWMSPAGGWSGADASSATNALRHASAFDLVIDRFDRRHAAPRIAPDVVGAEENAPPAPAPR